MSALREHVIMQRILSARGDRAAADKLKNIKSQNTVGSQSIMAEQNGRSEGMEEGIITMVIPDLVLIIKNQKIWFSLLLR